MDSADHKGVFATTHWTVVLAAAGDSSPATRQALERICRAYWPPLYAFARRAGHSPEDARDLTQGFFERLIERRDLATSDPERGRFRSFLVAMFKHFIAHERERARALRRGGGCDLVPLETHTEESSFGYGSADWRTPERAFEERWASVLLQTALDRLREEFSLAKRTALFDDLKGFLVGEPPEGGYAAAAARLGMTEGAAKMAVTRMRDRFRHLVRNEIAQTVSTPTEIEDELRYLRRVLSRG